MYKTRNTGTRNRMRGTRGIGVMLYSRECPQTYRALSLNIPGNVTKYSRECHQILSPIILGNVAKYSGECRKKFREMSPNIPGNIIKDSAECPQRVDFQIQWWGV